MRSYRFEMDVYRLEIDSTASSTAASPTTTSPTWQLVTYSGENRLALCVQAHSVVYDSRTDALMIFGGTVNIGPRLVYAEDNNTHNY